MYNDLDCFPLARGCITSFVSGLLKKPYRPILPLGCSAQPTLKVREAELNSVRTDYSLIAFNEYINICMQCSLLDRVKTGPTIHISKL